MIALSLAAYHLGSKSFWLDEAVSADYSRLGVSSLWNVVSGGDPNMGLYYVVLHLWVLVAGDSEAAIRGLSVVFAVCAVGVLVVVASRMLGRSTSLVAGLLLATSPVLIHYAQTARSYTCLVLLTELSTYFFIRTSQRRSRMDTFAWIVTSGLAIYVHYFSILVLGAQVLYTVVTGRSAERQRVWFRPCLAIGVLSLPELVFAARMGTHGISWIKQPTLHDVVILPVRLAGGRPAAALLGTLIAVGIYTLARTRRRVALLLSLWLGVPPLAALLESQIGQPVFVTAYLIVVLPPAMLLAAAGFTSIRSHIAKFLIAVLVGIAVMLGLHDWYRTTYTDFRGATRYVVDHAKAGDGIAYYPGYVQYGANYYFERTRVRGPALVTTGPALPKLERTQASPRHAQRIWMMAFGATPSVLTVASGPYVPSISQHFEGITVTLYVRRAG